MAPFIAAGLWLGCRIELPIDVRLAVNSLIGRDRLYPVLVGGKVGYIDREGRLVLPARYEPAGMIGIDAISMATPPDGMGYWQNRLVTWGRDFHEGRAAVRSGQDWQMIDAAGRELLDKPVDHIGEFQLGLAWFKVGGQYGLLDRAGQVRLPATSSAAPEHWDGLWMVRSDGNSILLDADGRQLTKNVYQRICPPGEGLMGVVRGRKWGFIDLAGQEVIPCQFDWADSFYRGWARVFISLSPRKRAWVDKQGRTVTTQPLVPAPQYDDGLYLIAKGNLFGLTDGTGKWIATPMYKFIGTFDCSSSRTSHPTAPAPVAAGASPPVPASVTLADQWEQAVQKLKDMYQPSKPPLAVVQTADDKWGVLDIDGRLRCQGLDDFIVANNGLRFSEGLARVTRDGKVGFVDETGRIAIEPQFDYAEDFNGGLSRFTMGLTPSQIEAWIVPVDFSTAKWGYVDRAARVVWQPTR
jgi:hypothetical protein